MLVIHPDECIDCGACEPVCPTKAIFPESDLPEKWAEYKAINADLLQDVAEHLREEGPASRGGRVQGEGEQASAPEALTSRLRTESPRASSA